VSDQPAKLIEQLRRAIDAAYSGSAEHGSFFRHQGLAGEYVPSPHMLIDQLAAQLAATHAAIRALRDEWQEDAKDLRRRHCHPRAQLCETHVEALARILGEEKSK